MSTFYAANCQPLERTQEAVDAGPYYYAWNYDAFERSLQNLTETEILSLSTVRDRWQGQNWPLIVTVEDLGRVRFASRMLCAVSPMAQGAVGGMTAYTIGPGYQDKAVLCEALRKHVLKSQSQDDDRKWAKILALCQADWDEFKRRANYEEWQAELFSRLVEEGEFFLHCGVSARRFDMRPIEPEQVRPLPGWRENGLFGVLTEFNDVMSPLAYGIHYSTGEYDAYEAEDVIHVKRNVVRTIKRGLPDFAWNAGLLVRVAGKLLYNMGVGSSIQAAIAFIRTHEFGSQSEVQNAARANADLYRTNPRTGQTEYSTLYQPGTVIDTGGGSTYAPPPYGSYASSHLPVVTAVCQGVAAAKNLPHWMISGDISTANFASTVVAESPFVQRVRQWQGVMRRVHENLFRRCLVVGVNYGRLPEEVLDYVELQSTPPSVVTRKPQEKAAVDQIYFQMKLKSPQTIQQEESLDSDQEAANWRQWEQEHPQQGGQGSVGMPGEGDAPVDPQRSERAKQAAMARGLNVGGKQPGLRSAVGEGPERESVEWDESKHPRDHGKFSSKPGAGGESNKDDEKKASKEPHEMTKAEFASKPLSLEVGKDFPSEVYHGTINKSAQAFMSGGDLDERDRSKTLSEFGSNVIYVAEPAAPHQALMFGSGKSVKGARTLIAMKLKDGAKILDLSPYMTRRPAIGSVDKPVLDIQAQPSFVEDMREWLNRKRESRGMAALPPERIDRAVNPQNPEFSVEEYAGLLPGYARDRGYAAFRLPDETVIVDRSAIESARKVSAKERSKLEQQANDTKSKRSKHSLYTDAADLSAKDRLHRAHIEDALESGKHVSSEVLADYPDLANHRKAKEEVDWDESKHPRADDGKFGKGSGKKKPHPDAARMVKYTDPQKAHALRSELKAVTKRMDGLIDRMQSANQRGDAKTVAKYRKEFLPLSDRAAELEKQVYALAKKEPPHHPGSAHGSTVTVKPTTQRVFGGEPVPVKAKLSKQETGRVGEAVVVAYLKAQGFADAGPMNTEKTNFPIDLIEDHRPTEVKTGLVSNGRSAQQWRLTFSKETPAEIEAYEQMTPEERSEWNAEKQKRIRERKEAAIKELEKKHGQKVKPRTMTVILNPDTQTADLYSFDGFHDRIGWTSDEAKAAYVGSVTYAH